MEPIEIMNLFFQLIIYFAFLSFSANSEARFDLLLSDQKLKLTKTDHIIAEHMVNMIKLIEQGYINQEVLYKVLNETKKSKHFQPFSWWLEEISTISKLKTTESLSSHCRAYTEKRQRLPLERVLERIAGNYCRERALESIGREIEKTNNLSDDAINFIQGNLRFYLTKKNKKNFSFFIRSLAQRPEVLRKISQEVTSYSVRHEVVPTQEVLKDILINEQITKLIQDKGFNPLQHQNVFYAEYGKLIEQGYRVINSKPTEDKVKDHLQYLKNYLELNQDHLPVGLCLTRLNDFSKGVFRGGFKNLSRDIFKFIIKKNNKEILEDAQFFLLWTYLYENEFKEAYKIANQNGLIKNIKLLSDARLKFWVAYIHEEIKEVNEAIAIHEDIILNHPLSYYGIMSAKKLQMLRPDSPAVTFYISNSLPTNLPNVVTAKDLDDDYVSSLVRLRAWAKIDSARMMKIELRRLKNHSMPSILVKSSSEKQLYVRSDLHLLNATIIQNSENYLATFKYLYEVMEKKEVIFNRQFLEILYPRPFYEVLSKNLKGEALDPIVLLSLIRQESVFNPQARSPVGARGLMQLMPRTAKRYRSSVRDSHLVNPNINIDLGTKYFKTLMKRYDGNLVYVLAAYNAGESRVERWKTNYFDTDASILKNIEAIPFLETRNYVKLIFRNIFFYKLLIERKEQIADSRDHNKLFDIYLGFNK